MNDTEFDELLESRLDAAWQPVAAAPIPRGRFDLRRGSRVRYAIRIPALLATPVLAALAVVVVAGASTVAKTVVTGSPSPLVWTSHTVSTQAPAATLPVAPRPGTSSAGHRPGNTSAATGSGKGDQQSHGVHGASPPAAPAPGNDGPDADKGHGKGASGADTRSGATR